MTFAPECAIKWDGALLGVLLFAIPVAMLITVLTVTLYRRSVKKAMRISAGKAVDANVQQGGSATTQPLTISVISDAGADASQRLRQSRVAMRKLSTVYVLAGFAQSVVILLLYFWLNGIEFRPLRTLMVWLPYAWPIILTLTLTAAATRGQKYALIVGYFSALLLTDAAADVFDMRFQPGFGELFKLWAIIMGPPTLVMALLSNRAWRSVGLIALFFAIVLVGSYILGFQALGCLALSTRDSVLLDNFFYLLAGSILLFFGMAWFGLRRLVRSYREKRYSDQMQILDSWWLLVTLLETLSQTTASGVASFSFLLAFVAYKALVKTGLRRMRPNQTEEVPGALLMLRVFGFTARTRQLNDQVSQYWRYHGPINMIGGTDLATALIEPDELLQFWSGKLRQNFIADEADLHARLQAMDSRCDPDGRYRINEFFCHDNTWQATVKALAQRSTAVLMDLRGFGKTNRGCEFELGMLLAEVPLARMLLLVDGTTKLEDLEPLLQSVWEKLPDTSPNRALATPVLRLFHAQTNDKALKPLLSRLLG